MADKTKNITDLLNEEQERANLAAAVKAQYKVKGESGYEVVHFETNAGQVIETDDRKFVTPAEKTAIADATADIAALEATVNGVPGGEGVEAVPGLVDKVADNTDAIETLNGDKTVEGSVAKQIDDAIKTVNDAAGNLAERVEANETKLAGLEKDTVQAAIDQAQTDAEAKAAELDDVVRQEMADTIAAEKDATKAGSLAKAIADEKSRAERVESGLDTRLKALEEGENSVDTKIAAAKKEITEAQAKVDNAQDAKIEALEKANAEGGAVANAIKAAQNAADAAQADVDALDKQVNGDPAVEGDKGLVDRLEAVEGKAHEHANKELLDTYTQTETDLADAVAKKHEHENKAVLDGITTNKVTAWDAAEQNAKDYADGLDEAMNGRVEALEGTVGDAEGGLVKDVADLKAAIGADGSVADQIKAAVDAEAELREEADNALAAKIGTVADDTNLAAMIAAVQADVDQNEADCDAAIKAITNDYLKAADKTELEGKIQSNADAIELLTNGVTTDTIDSVNDLIAYVNSHGAEVTGIKNDIKDNADAIDDLQDADAAQDELLAGLRTDVDLKATSEDLGKLEVRVKANEDFVAAQPAKDKAQDDKIAALEAKFGEDEGGVADMIADAIDAQAAIQLEKDNAQDEEIAKKADKTTVEGIDGRLQTAEGKLAGIEEGAQVNVIEVVKVNGKALEVTDKAVDIAVPTGALASKDEVTKDELAEALVTEIEGKADADSLGDLAALDTVAEANLDTALAEKINGKANTADLGALATKDKVAEADLEEALATKINGKVDKTTQEAKDAAQDKAINNMIIISDEEPAADSGNLIWIDTNLNA